MLKLQGVRKEIEIESYTFVVTEPKFKLSLELAREEVAENTQGNDLERGMKVVKEVVFLKENAVERLLTEEEFDSLPQSVVMKFQDAFAEINNAFDPNTARREAVKTLLEQKGIPKEVKKWLETENLRLTETGTAPLGNAPSTSSSETS